MTDHADSQKPILVLTVEQIQTLLLKTWSLTDDCEVAVGFLDGASGLGLYAWPVREGSVLAEPLFSIGSAQAPRRSRKP